MHLLSTWFTFVSYKITISWRVETIFVWFIACESHRPISINCWVNRKWLILIINLRTVKQCWELFFKAHQTMIGLMPLRREWVSYCDSGFLINTEFVPFLSLKHGLMQQEDLYYVLHLPFWTSHIPEPWAKKTSVHWKVYNLKYFLIVMRKVTKNTKGPQETIEIEGYITFFLWY